MVLVKLPHYHINNSVHTVSDINPGTMSTLWLLSKTTKALLFDTVRTPHAAPLCKDLVNRWNTQIYGYAEMPGHE